MKFPFSMIKETRQRLKNIFARCVGSSQPERLFLPELPHLTAEEFCGVLYHTPWYQGLSAEKRARISSDLRMKTNDSEDKFLDPHMYSSWIGDFFGIFGMQLHQYQSFMEDMRVAIRDFDLSLTLPQKEAGAIMLLTYEVADKPIISAQPTAVADDGDWSHIITPTRG